MCNEKLHKYRKKLQNITQYVFELQITKKDLKPLKKKIISQTQKNKNCVLNGTSSNPNYPKLLMITIVTKI
jgi:hypothetical protein